MQCHDELERAGRHTREGSGVSRRRRAGAGARRSRRTAARWQVRRRRRRRLVVDNYRFAAAVAFVLEKGGFRGKGMSSSLIRRGATGFDFGEQREAEGALGGRRRVPFCICRRWLVFFFLVCRRWLVVPPCCRVRARIASGGPPRPLTEFRAGPPPRAVREDSLKGLGLFVCCYSLSVELKSRRELWKERSNS